MTYWTLSIIKIVMGITTEELHQSESGEFLDIFGKIWNAFPCFPYFLIWIFL